MFFSHFADFVEARFSDIAAKNSEQRAAQNIGRIMNVKIHPRKCDQRRKNKQCSTRFFLSCTIDRRCKRKRRWCMPRRKRPSVRSRHDHMNGSIHVAWSRPLKHVLQDTVTQNAVQKQPDQDDHAESSRFRNYYQNNGNDQPKKTVIPKTCDKAHKPIKHGIVQFLNQIKNFKFQFSPLLSLSQTTNNTVSLS